MQTEISIKTAAFLEEAAKLAGDKDAVFTFDYGLDFNNGNFDGHAAIYPDFLYYTNKSGEIIALKIIDMSEIEYIHNIGCVSIECIINGALIELCRSDMKSSRAFQNAVICLKAISEGREVLEQNEMLNTFCPKCGMPYSQGSNTCARCVDKKKMLIRMKPFIKPFLLPLSAAFFMFIIVSGINILLPLLNGRVVDEYLKAENPTTEGFVWLIVQIVIVTMFLIAVQIARSAIMVKTGNKIVVQIRDTVYAKVQQLSLSGISRRTAGELITRITSDSQVLREFVVDLLPEILQMGMILIALIVTLLVLDPFLTLLILVPIPLIFMLLYSLRHFMHKIYHKQWHYESSVNSFLHDVFSGIRVVKVFGNEKNEEARFDKIVRKVADISQKNEKTWNLIMPMANFMIGIGEYAVLLIVGSRVISGDVTFGELTVFLAYVSQLYGPIRWAAFIPRRITRCMTSMAKIFEIIDEECEVVDNEKSIDRELQGNIDFTNACFGYKSYEYVLKNIDLSIKKGEMLGIVGRSGVGKSTLINLIMRLYDLNEGRLYIDGDDIRDFAQHSLRSQIGVVLQETFLFRGTIYSNIAYAKTGCTHDDVIRAAKIANAHQFILKQPDGYNTLVGERGQTLSGGERQRIAIARAVLRNPRIMILDEATASLDTETEKLIQDAINTLTAGRTTIAIAHRLSTLKNATRLVVLEKGRIEESGTHDELIRNGKRYYKLVMAQRQMNKLIKHKPKEKGKDK